jgi:hypothetical protein
MPPSQQLQPVIDCAVAIFFLAGVAAMMGKALGHHSIPFEDKSRLTGLYGKWAVNQAEAFCPEDDVDCVEREARRLYQSRLTRENRRSVE